MVNMLRLVVCSVYTHPNPFEGRFGNFLKQVHTFDWYIHDYYSLLHYFSLFFLFFVIRSILSPEAYSHVVNDFFNIIQNTQPHAMQSYSHTKTAKSQAIEVQKWGYLLSLLRNITFIDMKTQVPTYNIIN